MTRTQYEWRPLTGKYKTLARAKSFLTIAKIEGRNFKNRKYIYKTKKKKTKFGIRYINYYKRVM